jgi:Isocitrate dehydrogenase kinase/phosphatase
MYIERRMVPLNLFLQNGSETTSSTASRNTATRSRN